MWLNPLYKTWEQIKVALFQNLGLFTPEITDHSEKNPFIMWLSVVAGLHEQNGYYIDNQARESNVETVRQIEFARDLAKAYDYRLKAATPASVQLKLERSGGVSAFMIPQNSTFSTSNGIVFRTTKDTYFAINQTIAHADAKQIGSLQTVTIDPIYSGGIPFAQFQIEEPTNEYICDFSIVMQVDSTVWQPIESLVYANGKDKVFVPTIDRNGKFTIETGDGVMGKVVPSGNITASYYTTSAELGNVMAGAVNTVVSYTMPVGAGTLTVTNPQDATGGAYRENVETIRQRTKRLNRTKLRAVSSQDYKDVAELFPNVLRANVAYNCGKFVQMYILPLGGGIASDTLISDLQAWFVDKKMLTTKLDIFAAGIVELYLEVEVKASYNLLNSVVANDVRNSLTNTFAVENQEIGGSAQLSDIYQAIETTNGVINSKANVIKAIPYARPISPTITVLDWDKEVQSTSSTTNKWTLLFINSTQFQIVRNGIYLATGTVGVAYTHTDIIFTVNSGGYSTGDRYEFFTYPVNQTIILTEQSIINFSQNSIITVTGGQ